MLDQATAVFVTDAGRNVLRILGEPPSPGDRAGMDDLLQDRPAARRLGRGMALSVPLPPGRWCVWLLDDVPALAALGPMLTRAQSLCAGLAALGAPRPAGSLGPVAAALKGPIRRPEALVQFLGERLVEAGQAGGLAVFTLKGARVGRLWASDAGIARVADLLRNLIPLAGEGLFPAASDRPGALEAGLILERLGRRSLRILPPDGPGGYGAVLFDATEPPEGLAAEIPALMRLMRPLRQDTPGRRRWLKPLGWAAALALGGFLLWPVPQKITLTGVAAPAGSAVAALTSDAVLEAMLVRVGDRVTEGQPVAVFRSAALAEQAAQERLNIAVEDLNAQAAMAENNYGAVRLYQSRRQIAEARLAEIQRRLDQLSLTAPAAGRVIAALPPHVLGGSFTAGRDVVEVQTGAEFLMVLTPSRVDARRLHVGMTGEAMFRGLTDTAYPVEVISPPALVRDPQTGVDRLELTARIAGGDDRLLAGLTGYARLEGETTPRILGLAHYLIEYLGTTTWTYLGLRW